MRYVLCVLVAAFVAAFLSGCNVATADDDLGIAAEAATVDNAIIPNAIIPNAIIPNAIIPNAIIPNALTPGTLDAGSMAALSDPGQAGALSRLHVKYTVGCAFNPGQSFSFSWTDAQGVSHDETYVGILGLAPGWQSGPLDLTGQLWISACLAARTNYYGIPVNISMRGAAPTIGKSNTPEAPQYTAEEGAFWGNLYTSTPALYSCHVTADDANSRAHLRDCAAGHVEDDGTLSSCGIIQRLGTCDAYCAPSIEQGLFHPACWTDPHRKLSTLTLTPVTVALPPVLP